jgi:hypothetical protein
MTTSKNSRFPAALRAETLDNAADLLETAGWTRGLFRRWDEEKGHDTFCTIGALQVVAQEPDEGYSYGLQLAIQHDIAQVMGLENPYQVTKWNDRHRIGANVIAKLRKVAQRIRDEEEV